MLYHTVLHGTVHILYLHHVIRCYTILCYRILYYFTLYSTVPNHIILYPTMLYYAILSLERTIKVAEHGSKPNTVNAGVGTAAGAGAHDHEELHGG